MLAGEPQPQTIQELAPHENLSLVLENIFGFGNETNLDHPQVLYFQEAIQDSGGDTSPVPLECLVRTTEEGWNFVHVLFDNYDPDANIGGFQTALITDFASTRAWDQFQDIGCMDELAENQSIRSQMHVTRDGGLISGSTYTRTPSGGTAIATGHLENPNDIEVRIYSTNGSQPEVPISIYAPDDADYPNFKQVFTRRLVDINNELNRI